MPQILDIPIDGGLDENADERIRDRLSVADDVVYLRRGGLTPRLGQEEITASQVVNWLEPGGRDLALVGRGPQVAVIKNSVVRPLALDVGAVPANVLSNVGVASAYVVERDNVDGSCNAEKSYTLAEGDGFRCYAWVVGESRSVGFRVVDADSNAVIMPTQAPVASAVSGVRAVYANGLFFLVFFDFGGGGGLKIFSIDPVARTRTITTIPGTGSTNYTGLAAIAHPNGTHLIVAWQETAGQLRVSTLTATTAPAIVGTINLPTLASPVSIGLSCLVASRCWLAFGTGGGIAPTTVEVNVARIDVTAPAAPVSVLAPVAIFSEVEDVPTTGADARFVYMTAILDRAGGGAFVAFTPTGGDTTTPEWGFRPMTGLYRVNDAGAVQDYEYAFGGALQSEIWTNVAGTAFCIVAQTRPWMLQDRVGIVPALGCMHVVAFLRSVADVTAYGGGIKYPCQVHATFGVGVTPTGETYDARTAYSSTDQTRHASFPSAVVQHENGSVFAMGYALERADTSAHVYTAEAIPTTSRAHAQMGGRTFITGGFPTLYDGRSAVDWGFVHAPRYVGAFFNSTENGITEGFYSWAAAYEWIDANGGVVRSAPSRIITNFGSGGVSFMGTITITSAQLSHKADKLGGMGKESAPAYLCLYRTAANSTGPFYRLTAIEVPVANFIQYGLKDQVLIDKYPDAGGDRGPIESFPTLYTTGGILEADPVPSCTMVTTWQQRFVIAGVDDDSVWFSTENEDGEVPYFSLGLRLSSFENGRITGLAVLDEKLVLFKKDAVYTLSGQLPNKQGFGAIPSPVQVSSDAGCVDPQSVVVFPHGVMFRSARGIYLLDRSLQVSFVGEPIARTVEASAKTIAPVLITKQNHIRFDVHDDVDSGPGSVAVFDYLRGAWTRFVLRRQGDSGSAPCAQLVAADGTVFWLDGNATLFRERRASYTDNGSALFTYGVRTGWQKPAGLQGYFTALRAGVLGKYGGPHTVTVNVYADYDDQTIVAANVFELNAPPPAGYQLVQSVVSGRTSRMQSIALEAIVTPSANTAYTGPTAPAVFSSFILEWDPIDNAPQRRVPSTQKR